MRLAQDYILHIESAKDGVHITAEWQGELVRCKDCKWSEKAILDEYCVECTMYHTSCMKHGFCHHGERREE